MEEVINFLNNILNIDDTVVVALSGGPDSMCLVHLLNSLKKIYNLKIVCAHVNHNVRIESEEEKAFVKNYCSNNNLIFEYFKIDNYSNNKFTEVEARKIRYKFFDDVVKKYQAKYLFTAHHGDDLIETVLMKIVRGSNIKGYIGIPKIKEYQNYKIVRPLLYVTKNDIINYLNVCKIDYVIDNSNKSLKYTRNRYRAKIVPLLKNEDKNVHKKFLKYSESLERANDYIEKIVTDKKVLIVKDNIINIKEFNKEDEYIRERILQSVIEDIQENNLFNISDVLFSSILGLAKKNTNSKITLANGFVARRSYNNLIIEREENIEDFNIEFKDNLKINNYIFNRVDEIQDNSNFVIRLDSNELTLPLIFRNRRDGDKIELKKIKGSKKIKDVFIDSKVDIKKRNEIPILIDSSGKVLWIPGIKKSIFAKDKHEKCDIIIRCMEEKNE